MAYARKNPYITLDELREELKMKPEDILAGSSTEDDLLRAIDNASRWVDDYTRRDYFFHDCTTAPMVFDQFDDGVFKTILYPRFFPVITLTKIQLNGLEVEAAKYFVKNVVDPQTIVSLNGSWFPNSHSQASRQTVELFGTFGYLQNTSYPVTIAGDTAGQLSAFSLTGTLPGVLYWKLTSPDPDVALLQLFTDSAMTALVAEGKTAQAGTAINLWAMNGSGINGTGNVSYTADDSDAANTFTPGVGVYDASSVPVGIPDKIRLATRLVAAAISGRNQKEIIDLTGAKTSIATSAIPKTVFDMLGRRAPILT